WGEILGDELEHLLQWDGHNTAEVFEVDVPGRQTPFSSQRGRLPFDGIIGEGRAMLELELFGPAQRHFEAISQVIGEMITANSEHTRVLDNTTRIDDVISRAAAHIDDQRAKFLLFAGEQSHG